MPLVPLAQYKVPRKAAAARVAVSALVPAPVAGLNYRDALVNMKPTDALVMTNVIPKQDGIELRSGWQYFSTTTNAAIKSIFAYNAGNSANSKLFAGSSGKIYDVTSGTPSIAVASTSSTDVWSTTHFSTTAGIFMVACSAGVGSGYYTYDPTGGWVFRTPAGAPANIITVCAFKQRLFFSVEGSASIFYVNAVNAIAGTLNEFPIGSQLRNGGYVVGMTSWTIDGGFGIDDYLAVFGSEGDVVIYQGTDPSSPANWSVRGTWYVGAVPKYGRFYTNNGGDVMVVSTMGLVPLSRLLQGSFNEGLAAPSDKIQPVLAPLVQSLRLTASWETFIVPDENILVIKPPQDTTGAYTQFAMNLTTGAWCSFDSIPMTCCTLLAGKPYCGTSDGRVFKAFTGNLDGVAIAGTGGTNIEGDIQTAFSSFDSPAMLKKFNLGHPIFISTQQPAVKMQMNTQFTFSGVPGSPSFSQTSGSLWSASQWSVARWSGSSGTYQAWVGLTGLGFYGSLRMKIRGVAGTTFTGCQVMMEPGGLM
jgi:hypothetical protein